MSENELHSDTHVDLEKQVYDLKQLLEISKSLSSTLDYAILIDSILFTCMAQLKVLRAGLFARKGLDYECFTLHRNYKGFEVHHGVDYSIPEGHPLIRLFNQRYACYSLGEIHSVLGHLTDLECLEELAPTMLVPLKSKGQINGFIILGDRIDDGEFDAYEREYILNIAILASIAINNAFLFEMTTTDMMTKLKMKHYFFSTLMERYNSSEPEKQTFNIIMLDIDYFKKFNDSWGHSCGDAVLKQVAHIIAENIRTVDIAARYGGEEFIVLVPDADCDQSMQVAERIRLAVEASEYDYEGMKLKVTISCGVACYNKSVDYSPREVVDRADRALYRSKQEGRNRTSLIL